MCVHWLTLSMLDLGVRIDVGWSLCPCGGCLWGFLWIGGDSEEFPMARRRDVHVCVHACMHAWGRGSAHLVRVQRLQ